VIIAEIDMELEFNIKKQYPTNKKDLIQFTAEEMKKAANALDPEDWDQFLDEVCQCYLAFNIYLINIFFPARQSLRQRV
jgi:hypothetical protein